MTLTISGLEFFRITRAFRVAGDDPASHKDFEDRVRQLSRLTIPQPNNETAGEQVSIEFWRGEQGLMHSVELMQ